MTNWMKLLLPVGLAVLAAVANGMAMYPQMAPGYYLMVARDIREGEFISAGDLAKVEIHGDQVTLPKTALPYARRGLMHGPARRRFARGELVLWQDTKPATGKPQLRDGEIPLEVPLPGMSQLTRYLQIGQEVRFLMAPAEDLLTWDPVARRMRNRAGELVSQSTTELVGPFRVVAIGGRVKPGDEIDPDRNVQTHVLTVAIRLDPERPQRLDPLGERLQMAATGRSNERIYNVITTW